MSDNFPRWLRYPVRDGSDWMARSRDLVARSTPLTALAEEPALFGSAFELCTVLDLADRMPYPHLLAALPPCEAVWTALRTGYCPPHDEPDAEFCRWYRHRTVPPVWLHAAGSNLALLLDFLWRDGDIEVIASRWPLNARLRIVAREAATFRAFWQAHCAGPREALRRLGPVRAADVPFRGGHWIGDLIAGMSMVEIKTGVMTDERLADAVLQTVGYALLAQDAGYDVTDVVIHLARYGLVIQTPLQQLADDLAGAVTDLDEARGALASDERPWRPNFRAAHHQGLIRGLEPGGS
jgi:hypothetical protein